MSNYRWQEQKAVDTYSRPTYIGYLHNEVHAVIWHMSYTHPHEEMWHITIKGVKEPFGTGIRQGFDTVKEAQDFIERNYGSQ